MTRGRDGWLFLADDTNDVMGQHSGERRLSPSDLERWVSLLECRAALVAGSGAEYVLMVAPDTHSVYPEKLPAETRHASMRPVHQLLDALNESGSRARVLYPLDQMLEAKQAGRVCSRIDAHWTHLGAYTACSHLLDVLGESVPVRRLRASEIWFQNRVAAGDLGNKISPARIDTQLSGLVRYPEARLLYDNCIDNTGAIAVTKCPEAPPTVCLLLGDSYSYQLLRFLSESFRRLVVAHSACLDQRMLRDVEPDVVVSLMAERFLIDVPDDDADPGLAAHEQEKRNARRLRAPLADWAYRRPSPTMVERLREHFLLEGRLADATVISVLAYAGLLPRELTSLRWSDVGERNLTVRAPVDSDYRTRAVSLIAPLADDLSMWWRASGEPDPNTPVFPGRVSSHWADGEWASWSSDVFVPAVRACGLDIERPHELRHTFCTLFLHEGRSAREIARMVGGKARLIKELYAYVIGNAGARHSIDASEYVAEIRTSLADQRGPLPSAYSGADRE